MGELFPLLVRALDQSQIVAMQFLRVSRVRVTVRTQAYREELLKSQFMFEDVVIPVSPADRVAKVVYVRDLPFELSAESVQSVFSVFGEVYSVQFVYHKEFPTICTGTRIVLMSVQVPVPSTVIVLGFECRVWYPGQPLLCSICQEPGHLARACPLSGLCRRCKQPGHKAQEYPHGRSQPSRTVQSTPPAPVLSSVQPSCPVPSSVSHAVQSTPPVSVPCSVEPSSPGPSTVPMSVEPSHFVPSTVKPSISDLSTSVSDVSSEDEGAISSDSSVASSSLASVRFYASALPNVPPVTVSPSVADFKKLVSLVLTKVKLGAGSSQVRVLAVSLCKSHKLCLSNADLDCVVSAVSQVRPCPK